MNGFPKRLFRLHKEPILLLVLIALTSLSWLFVKVADEVREGETLKYDTFGFPESG